jgi:hypothetical protein
MLPFYRLNTNFSLKREPYRAKTLIIFRDFNIINLIEGIRKTRTIPLFIKTDIYALRFALITGFYFKKLNFLQYCSRFIPKRTDFHFGTVRANAFYRIDLFYDSCGTVRAFKIK